MPQAEQITPHTLPEFPSRQWRYLTTAPEGVDPDGAFLQLLEFHHNRYGATALEPRLLLACMLPPDDLSGFLYTSEQQEALEVAMAWCVERPATEWKQFLKEHMQKPAGILTRIGSLDELLALGEISGS